MSAGDQDRIWVLLEDGETLTDIGKAIGRSITTVRSFVLRHGGQRPPEPTVWSDKRIIGNRSTALATLVERMTRYTVLVQLPGKRTMEALNASPWQRGTNENTNGLLRQWWLRSMNFYTLDPSEIQRVQTSLNARPRHTLGWQTPAAALELAVQPISGTAILPERRA